MISVYVLIWLVGACTFSFLNAAVYNDSVPRDLGTDFFGGCIALLCVYQFGYNLTSVVVFTFFGMLTLVACVDVDTMEIPDEYQLVILILAVISIVTLPGPSLMDRILGAFSISVPLLLISLLIPGGFGGGDIKLMAVCGLLLGWKTTLIAFFLAVLSGGVYGCYLLCSGKKKGRDHFAFGPFLCAGMMLATIWGDQLLNWYLHLCTLL
jgi:leader peptidase (prepilin peptidase)/N-methyltransferase